MTHFTLPEPVQLRVESLGLVGAQWLDGLAQTIARLETDWSVETGAVLSGGSAALVLEAQRADGTPAVLKLGLPDPESDGVTHEADVLRLAKGRGYVTLYDYDPATKALLLERLGMPLANLPLSHMDEIEILCATLKKAWSIVHSLPGLTTGAAKADWLAHFIEEKWAAAGQPCDRSVIDRALIYCRLRQTAHDPQKCVLVHGDVHAHNTLILPGVKQLSSPDCKFIDPDGLLAEPACDLATLMREGDDDLLKGDPLERGRARCHILSTLTGVDETAIWQWGFMERVSTGLHMIELGMAAQGRQALDIAARWCRD